MSQSVKADLVVALASSTPVVPPTSATTSLLSLVVFDRLIVLPRTFGVLARDFVRSLFTGRSAVEGAIEPVPRAGLSQEL